MCFSLKLKNKKLPPFLAEIWDVHSWKKRISLLPSFFLTSNPAQETKQTNGNNINAHNPPPPYIHLYIIHIENFFCFLCPWDLSLSLQLFSGAKGLGKDFHFLMKSFGRMRSIISCFFVFNEREGKQNNSVPEREAHLSWRVVFECEIFF
jgi:hypothetical protein